MKQKYRRWDRYIRSSAKWGVPAYSSPGFQLALCQKRISLQRYSKHFCDIQRDARIANQMAHNARKGYIDVSEDMEIQYQELREEYWSNVL